MLVLAALALFQPQIDPPRLRTILPNEATILVEPMKGDTISVQLWASAAGVEDTPETHGLRHLLEHLMVKGPDKNLGERLEARGCLLRARTLRDAMQFEITVPEGELALALSTVKELLQPLKVTAQEIESEASVMEKEQVFRDTNESISAAAWKVAYGSLGLNTFGDIEVIRAATPEGLQDVRKAHFNASNLTLVVVGPVGLDAATRDAKAILGDLPKGTAKASRQREIGKPGRVEIDPYGEARAVPVPAYDSLQTMAVLAAAMAIGTELERCFVTYTPSRSGGLIIIGRTEYDVGLGLYIDEISTAKSQSMFGMGKQLARHWVTRQLRSASGIGGLRGLLMSQSASHSPERMLEAIDAMRMEDFTGAIESFKKENAVIVVGMGR